MSEKTSKELRRERKKTKQKRNELFKKDNAIMGKVLGLRTDERIRTVIRMTRGGSSQRQGRRGPNSSENI